jgi:DNA mismatch repair protein MutL
MPIQPLDEHVIAQIAAGEVVERPASVVKELVENSLDAGATHIQVEIEKGGRKLIRVSDNGHGIPQAELTLAYARHATSKLRDADDLYRIHTLGFRGEALASIVAVSQTTIETRHRDEQIGSMTRIEGSVVVRQNEFGAAAGTMMTVENLFFNMPVRLKFLKTENTEKRQISNIITQYAMAYPQVRFVLVQEGREVFRSLGSGQLSDVIVKVLGLSNFKQMIQVQGEEPLSGFNSSIQVLGYVSEPSLHRKDRNRIVLFVNGRAIQDSSLTYAITQAYHNLLPKGRYPLATLLLQVPPEFVDVNVHPTKAEVRFREANAAFVAVQRVVRQALMASDQRNHLVMRPQDTSVGAWMPATQQPLDGAEEWGNITPSTSQDDAHTADPTAIPTGLGRPQRPRTLPPLRVVGQVGATYIVAEGPAGLYLVDQHSAHQRILYQQLLDEQTQSNVQSHDIEATTIDLSVSETKTMESLVASLRTWGVNVEPFGATSFVVRTLPTLVNEQFAEDIIATILAEAKTHDDSAILIPVVLARYGAYRHGRILKSEEMQKLIETLERCPNPQVSPDERPTLVHISADQLATEFANVSSN